ncbi:hypothetical protein, partial [uncultured Pseudomonas sp.]|uniref:hypothetical protein n=1 Tax=uncultured Pseudomonas sp. TaxID=114707 RepID=UPI0025F5EC7B
FFLIDVAQTGFFAAGEFNIVIAGKPAPTVDFHPPQKNLFGRHQSEKTHCPTPTKPPIPHAPLP